jgi:hypothetical protein
MTRFICQIHFHCKLILVKIHLHLFFKLRKGKFASDFQVYNRNRDDLMIEYLRAYLD